MSRARARKPGLPHRKGRQQRPTLDANPLLVDFLTELAAVLLAAGISSPEFEHSAKIGFIAAASRIARLGNTRINRSAVAAMTGLSRSEVKRLAESAAEPGTGNRGGQRALRVLEGWQTDPEFVDSSGAPRTLNLSEADTGFEALVRRYSGDIPPKAMLRELLRLGLVFVDEREVRVRKLGPDEAPIRQLESISAALAPLLMRFAARDSPATRLISRELKVTVPDSKAHRLLHRQLNEAIKSFFLNLQNAADGASLPRLKSRQRGRNTYVSVLVSD